MAHKKETKHNGYIKKRIKPNSQNAKKITITLMIYWENIAMY